MMHQIPLPTVSIVIPCYNAQDTIERCVVSALEQDYPFLEVIVSDDNSTDNTREILSNLNDKRLQVIFQKSNLGMNENFRFCLSRASGKLTSFLNNDDFLLPSSVSKRVERYIRTNNCKIVCSNATWQGARNDEFIFPFKEETNGFDVILWSLTNALNKIHWSTSLFDTQMAKQIGLSDNSFFDWVLWLRMLLRGNIGHVNESLTILLDHGSRVTKQRMKLKSKHCKELCLVFEEFLEKEKLPVQLQKAAKKGQFKLLQRYVIFSHDEFLNTQNKTKSIEEIKGFLKLSKNIQDRLLVTLALKTPYLFSKLRLFKKLFSSLLNR